MRTPLSIIPFSQESCLLIIFLNILFTQDCEIVYPVGTQQSSTDDFVRVYATSDVVNDKDIAYKEISMTRRPV